MAYTNNFIAISTILRKIIQSCMSEYGCFSKGTEHICISNYCKRLVKIGFDIETKCKNKLFYSNFDNFKGDNPVVHERI